MIELEKKRQRNEEFTKLHTLSEHEFKKMIAEKMERARFYSFSFKERESRAKLAD